MKEHEYRDLPQDTVTVIKRYQWLDGLTFRGVINAYGIEYLHNEAKQHSEHLLCRNHIHNKLVKTRFRNHKQISLSNFAQERVRPQRNRKGDEFKVTLTE